MIFETLAAMADYQNNKAFDFNVDAAEAKTVLSDVRNTLTVAGVAKTHEPLDYLNQHIVGILNKTPRKIVEDNESGRVY